MKPIVAVLAVLILGCGAEQGTPGGAAGGGSGGGNATSNATLDAGPAWTCAAGKNFCDGTRLWTCTRSGLDAVPGADCARYVDGGFCAPSCAHVLADAQDVKCCAP